MEIPAFLNDFSTFGLMFLFCLVLGIIALASDKPLNQIMDVVDEQSNGRQH